MPTDPRELNIRALIIDARAALAESFITVLEREVNLVECDFTNSLFKAVTLFAEIEYDFCFISDIYAVEDVTIFLKDAKTTASICLFAQLRDKVLPEVDRHQYVSLGIDTIVSRKMNHQDKDALRLGVRTLMSEQSFAEVKDSMQSLLDEIDRAAANKRKGIFSSITAKAFSKIKRNLEGHQELVSRYFDAMCDQALEITKRKAPPENLINYDGVSRRVRERLTRRAREEQRRAAAAKARTISGAEVLKQESKL